MPIIKVVAKRFLRSLIYRFPPVMIWPHRLYVWLDVLAITSDIAGEVLEVGCYLGGTAAISVKMLDAIGSDRSYTVIDTFNGFNEGQFHADVRLGASQKLAREFSSNSPSLTRWVLDRHGGKRVKIVQGDVTKIPDDQIPAQISACLLDVDLAEPIYEGLKRLYPRLVAGGIIAVDDCDADEGGYKARIGYDRFMSENGLTPEYKYGMGLIMKAR
jgi:O-methyltransferase